MIVFRIIATMSHKACKIHFISMRKHEILSVHKEKKSKETYVIYFLRLKSMKQNKQILPIKYITVSENQLVNTKHKIGNEKV